MLRALKKNLKKLGSSSKLHEAGAGGEPAPAAPPRPQGLSTLPPGLPRPPSAQGGPLSSQQQGPPSFAAAAAAEGSGRPAGAPADAAASQPLNGQSGGLVDYELVAGHLEFDAAEAAAEAGSGETSPHLPGELCYGSGEPAGALELAAAEKEAAAAAAEEGIASHSAAEGGGGGGTAAGAAGGEPEITDALATMMYLTEDAEGNDDCVSVVSDAISDDKDFPDDISELSRALEALEGEALHGSSPGAASVLSGGAVGGLEDQLAERLGISPDAADPTAFAQQMAKLYNNLGLKLMERRQHEEALGLLRKAEAVVDNGAMWPGQGSAKRARMKAITYNNLGCLFKRRNLPQVALQYLQQALALEEAGGPVQNSSSTHLNICAAFSALKRPKEALSHAERAIILLQRHLWPPHLPFQEGLAHLVRALGAPAASRHAMSSANVLAMAYHNAAVEHEKLGHLREALVSFTRAYLISSKCLGARAHMTSALSRALKAFQQRQARYLPTGAAHAARKAPSLTSGRAASQAALQSKRGLPRGNSKSSSGSLSKSAGSLSAKILAQQGSKATLPLDKGRTSSSAGIGVRPPSHSRLASALQQAQAQQQGL